MARSRPFSTPEPGWRPEDRRPVVWDDLRRFWAEMHVLALQVARIEEKVNAMSVNVDKLNSDIQALVAGYQSVVVERDALKAALAEADAEKAQAVADALAADNAVDQAAIDAADKVVADVLNPPAPEEPPADGGV